MSGMFGSKPKVPKAVPVPTIDTARQSQDIIDRMKRRRGRSTTLMTGMLGDTSSPSVTIKKLLGGG